MPHHGFHAARHYRASQWLTEGVPIHVVSRWLGHAQASMTLNVYAHVLDEIEDSRWSSDVRADLAT